MVSAPIWAVLALLQSWLLASPGEDVRPQDALWSVRPPERRAPYRVSAPRRHGRNEIPALTLELGVLEFGAPLAVAPIRTEGLTLCGPDWSRFGHWRELHPTTIRLPLPSSWTPRTPTETASTFRERDVDTYLGEPDEVVTLDVGFETLADGTLYPAHVVLDATGESMNVDITNADYAAAGN